MTMGALPGPKRPGVAEAVCRLLEDGAFNINRGNYTGAYEVAGKVLSAREKLARMFQVEDSRHVIFTSGVTCSLNYFINGFLKPGDHVLVTGLEHNAVMRPLHRMTKQGVAYDVIPVDRQGNLKAEQAESLIRPATKAMIVSHASNVCGTVVPIRDLGEVCRRHDLFFCGGFSADGRYISN